jgi:hypothetical protein
VAGGGKSRAQVNYSRPLLDRLLKVFKNKLCKLKPLASDAVMAAAASSAVKAKATRGKKSKKKSDDDDAAAAGAGSGVALLAAWRVQCKALIEELLAAATASSGKKGAQALSLVSLALNCLVPVYTSLFAGDDDAADAQQWLVDTYVSALRAYVSTKHGPFNTKFFLDFFKQNTSLGASFVLPLCDLTSAAANPFRRIECFVFLQVRPFAISN